jgi:hypothetical protein
MDSPSSDRVTSAERLSDLKAGESVFARVLQLERQTGSQIASGAPPPDARRNLFKVLATTTRSAGLLSRYIE